MKIVVRADAGFGIGGGHVMRGLALALAARAAGHDVVFVTADVPGTLADNIRTAGFEVAVLGADGNLDGTAVEHWRPLPIAIDVAQSLPACQGADWIVLDHYGLGGAWVRALRRHLPDIRILALDDLDREPLFADILLDPADVTGVRTQPRLSLLAGPGYALLRPEFAALRRDALTKNTGRRVLILPGMLDGAGLAPAALTAMQDRTDLDVEVIMGSQSESRTTVEAMVAGRPNWSLSLDVPDMATRMAQADFCIGAGGGTAWERCCLGLPSVAVAVAQNQVPGIAVLETAGAAIGLGPEALQEPHQITRAVDHMRRHRADMSAAAAALCDGMGAARVVAAMDGVLRPVTTQDARLLFDWRDQPHIRAISLDRSPLDWDTHLVYMHKIAKQPGDGLWFIYSEAGRDLGHVNARDIGDGTWRWSFYIGATDAPGGAGKRMLVAFLRRLFKQPQITGVAAQVVGGNPVSRHVHESLGFARVGENPRGMLEYFLRRCDVEDRLGLMQDTDTQ